MIEFPADKIRLVSHNLYRPVPHKLVSRLPAFSAVARFEISRSFFLHRHIGIQLLLPMMIEPIEDYYIWNRAIIKKIRRLPISAGALKEEAPHTNLWVALSAESWD
mgnify:CR=1 FL=1